MKDGGTFSDYLENNSLSTSSEEELKAELSAREKKPNIFPLEVFHEKIKPFINALVKHYDVPRSYVGLGMLSAYSTAIGSAYNVTMNGRNQISLAVWACMEGISSSGKSLAIDITHQPLYDIQEDFDKEWQEASQGVSREKLMFRKLKTTIYRDAHIPTLVRYVLPDNPKGVAKHCDEIMEWLNGMNQLSKKEGTDEQFWLSTWNGKNYSGIRSGKEKFVLHRPFVNVVGGIQPTITYKLFAKDRDTTGFIFRLLFATPETNKIASPDHAFSLDGAVETTHKKAIKSLYFGLPIEDIYEDPRKCQINSKALKLFYEWEENKKRIINRMDDVREMEIHSGILGKIKEYVLRFSALLQIADRAYAHDEFRIEDVVGEEVMQRAIKLGDYFYTSASEVYDRVNTSMTAPAEVIQVAALINSGRSYQYIAMNFYNDKITKQGVAKRVKRWISEYPRVFRANAR